MLSARAVAAWSATALLIALLAGDPAYRLAVVLAGLAFALVAAGPARARGLLLAAGFAMALGVGFNLLLAHVGATVLFSLPDGLPGVGGPYTLEAFAFGLATGLMLAAAMLAVAPFSLCFEPHDVVDALPRWLSRTGGAVAASLGLVPMVSRSFAAVSEAQRLRGWRPRGPRSWSEVVVPVVLTTIEGSMQLAESMEARGYGSGPRTRLRAERLSPRDRVLVAASALALALYLIARAGGADPVWQPYPTLTAPVFTFPALATCALLLTPVLLWRRSASTA